MTAPPQDPEDMAVDSTELWNRVADRVSVWQVAIDRTIETESSIIAFGRRGDHPVVLKVVKVEGEEWRSGGVVDAFEGRGVVGVIEYVDGAMLLERLHPGNELARLALGGADDQATRILATVIQSMSPRRPLYEVATVEDWGKGFERYAASGDGQIPDQLVSQAHRVYVNLCATQTSVRLLHGDLHHHNVLFDAARGWLAIDPKGVLGEPEYEVGAALRNPCEKPELFAQPATIRRRVQDLCRQLDLDDARVLSWAFAQAVLSAVWTVEDGSAVEHASGSIALAEALRPNVV